MLKKMILASMVAFLGLYATLFAWQDDEPKIEKSTSPFMQKKLDYSREIVAGLATEDFERIGKAAQDLMMLSHEADWNVATTPQYLKASNDFRDTTSRLRDVSHDKNLDGATLAYFEVTLNCVRCHKQLRNPTPKKTK